LLDGIGALFFENYNWVKYLRSIILDEVFVIPFRVRPVGSSIMPPEYAGAYVNCYAAGSDYREAVEKALKRLSEDGLYPDEVLEPVLKMATEEWTQHISEQWPDYVAAMPDQVEFQKAINEGAVVYGPFGTYE
jgi:hypothetical protein